MIDETKTDTPRRRTRTTSARKKAARKATAVTKAQKRVAAEEKANKDALLLPGTPEIEPLVPGTTPSLLQLRRMAKATDRRLVDKAREAAKAGAQAIYKTLGGNSAGTRTERRLKKAMAAQRAIDKANA